jgi:choice-of-anchor B domain-containing protein
MQNKLLLPLLCLLPLFSFSQQEANLLGRWMDTTLVGSAWYDNIYNEVWGITVNGHEYAIVGSTAGTHFIDVTDPANLYEAHFVAGADEGPQIIHRDYHDYNGYLFAVCDEGQSTMQIMDIRQLPDTVIVAYDSDDEIRRAHNIFIDTAYARLYAFALDGGPLASSALRIYDISDPASPQVIDEHKTFGDVNASHVHDGYVRDNIAFLNCGGAGFAIVDFTDPLEPVTLSTITNYIFQGYNHSGWLSDDAQYYYMADENHGYKMKVVDVSDPCNAEVAGTFDAEVETPNSIAHNQLVSCNYLYVSYYYDGMVVYDISDPANPEKVLYYDTSDEPNLGSYKGAWGIYPHLPSGNILVIDMQEGLFVFEGMGDNCDPNANLEPVDISCLSPVSTEQEAVENIFEVFPQPATNVLHLRTSMLNPQEQLNLQLFNMNGQPVQQWTKEGLAAGIQQIELPLHNIAPGIYLLQAAQSTGLQAIRVVIQ